mmetsp:Transcript_13861/g.23423  ORF Transcript_13861/g.23423 Transcript_13861/m.23423 type:complete len:317 (+) Transcript_13861:334-1284(+)
MPRKPAPEHPKYDEMVKAAIVALNERTGSSVKAIAKYLAANYKLPENYKKTLGTQLKKLTASGKLVKVKASFKLSDEFKKAKKPKAAQKALSEGSNIIKKTEEYVRGEIEKAGNDSSHDWWHIVRVRNLALTLAKEEGLATETLETVQLAALLHDLHDWKYSGSETAGAEAASAFLSEQGYPANMIEVVVSTIQRVGFKDELEGAPALPVWPELAVVQDADRLDAMGAIGIARCLTFGGSRSRVLHDPSVEPRHDLSKADYCDANFKQTTINHFPEKLLKLRGLMKTTAGRRMAEERHTVMEDYLDRFFREWAGQA